MEATSLSLVSDKLQQVESGIYGQNNVPVLESQSLQTSDTEESDREDSDYSTGVETPDEGGACSDGDYFGNDCAETQSLLESSPSTPSPALTFTTIPPELHYLIFSHLDAIDSTCLSLTSHHFHSIHATLQKSIPVPLQTRRSGPNRLERAWKGIAWQECRHCGVHRCQLYRHLKDWMPKEYEYCAIRGVYGMEAEEGATKWCFRSNPSKPDCCGRHRV
jgi:hypothetical protein